MIRASIIGAAGYAGGELVRLLLGHPNVELVQVTSRSRCGKFVRSVNPNLRKLTDLKFTDTDAELKECDVLFLCLPHGLAMESIERYQRVAPKIVDLSADFRLNNSAAYETWYGKPHLNPALLDEFCYGIVEINRHRIAKSNCVACAGCNATAVILASLPLVRLGSVRSIVAEVKVGSSEGGSQINEASHHPLRSGAVRSYRPTGHRHLGEIKQELGINDVYLSATAIGMVRGAVATCHIFFESEAPSEKQLWQAYRQCYSQEPFIRIVKERIGAHRYPDPKHLAGSNFCDIGFEREVGGSRVVAISAIDNLMKGAAGQAVQNFNIMFGLPQTTGLEFPGLFPA